MAVNGFTANKRDFVKYGLIGFAAALVLLAPLGFMLFGLPLTSASSSEIQLEGAESIPEYMHPESKGETGLRSGVHLGDHRGLEYWEGVDSAGYHCLLVGDPISKYSSSSCTTEERFQANGTGVVFIFPNSVMEQPVESHLIPSDVATEPLATRGYEILGQRVAVSFNAGAHDGEVIGLERSDRDQPEFFFKGTPVMDESAYRN